MKEFQIEKLTAEELDKVTLGRKHSDYDPIITQLYTLGIGEALRITPPTDTKMSNFISALRHRITKEEKLGAKLHPLGNVLIVKRIL